MKKLFFVTTILAYGLTKALNNLQRKWIYTTGAVLHFLFIPPPVCGWGNQTAVNSPVLQSTVKYYIKFPVLRNTE